MKKLTFFILSILLFGCEELVNFKYSADKRDNSNIISGRVTDIQTGMFIPDADVKIGIYNVKTDHLGYFTIRYEIGTAEDRNKAIPVVVSAFNYTAMTDSLFPFPGQTTFSPKLLFAAPLFELVETRSSDINELELIVHVRDNQGYETISTVDAEVFYVTDKQGGRREIFHPMRFEMKVDDFTAEYRCKYETVLEDGVWVHDGRLRIHVTDNDGHYSLYYKK